MFASYNKTNVFKTCNQLAAIHVALASMYVIVYLLNLIVYWFAAECKNDCRYK